MILFFLCIEEMYSDIGINLRGVADELKKAVKYINNEKYGPRLDFPWN